MQANIPCGILYQQDHVGNQLLGLNFPTNLCKRKSLNLRNHTKLSTMMSPASLSFCWIGMSWKSLWWGGSGNGYLWVWRCADNFWHIPGSSKYVAFVPFGRFFFRVKRHNFYTLGRFRYIYINICVVQLQYWRLCLSCPASNSINRCNRVSIKNPSWNSVHRPAFLEA